MNKVLNFLWIFVFMGWVLASGPVVAAGTAYFSTEFSKTPVMGGESRHAQAQTPLNYFSKVVLGKSEDPEIPGFMDQFKQGQTLWGFQIGYGLTFDLPPPPPSLGDRTDIEFLYFFPNYKFNLTGVVGEGAYRGALYWVVEGGVVAGITNPELNNRKTGDAPNFVIGFVPLQLEYKFLNPHRRWVPFVFGGAGVSVGDFQHAAEEISTAFEFILNTGGGIEYFFENGRAVSLNYHFWHLSNSNIKSPNVGLNAHVFTIGFSF